MPHSTTLVARHRAVGHARRSDARWCRSLVLLASVVGLALGSLLGSANAAASTRLSLVFDSPSGSLGSTQTSFTNAGSAMVKIAVATSNGGRVTSQTSRSGEGDAVAFPNFNSTASGPRAVIRVTSAGSSDGLSPGSSDFSWGADFTLSPGATASKSSGSRDNGDNLMQRGLYAETQYKLQLDGHQPSCRLRGSTGDSGAVKVAAPVTVSSGAWYGATCQRSGSTLTIAVVKYDGTGGVAQTWTASKTSSVGFGQVRYSSPSIPLSVGGKLDNSGAIDTSASDQFNGSVDNVALSIPN